MELINEPTQTHMKPFEWNDESVAVFARLVLTVSHGKPARELGSEEWRFDLEQYKRQRISTKIDMFKTDYMKEDKSAREQLDLFAKQLQEGMMASFDRKIKEYKLQHGITD